MAGELLKIGARGILCFVVLRLMAMIYLWRKPADDYIAQPGYDALTDIER